MKKNFFCSDLFGCPGAAASRPGVPASGFPNRAKREREIRKSGGMLCKKILRKFFQDGHGVPRIGFPSESSGSGKSVKADFVRSRRRGHFPSWRSCLPA